MKIYITDKALPKKQEIMALLEKRKWYDLDFSGMDFDVDFVHVAEGDPKIDFESKEDSYALLSLYYSLIGILSGCSND